MADLPARLIGWVRAHRDLDAILIGIGGAATYLASALLSVIQNPASWNPEGFGVGFGAMATGIGLLFRLRQHGDNDDDP